MAAPRYDVFRYLSATDHADDYRAVMREFAAAKARFIVHLRPEELSHAVGARVDLTALLDQLVAWGNLKADPDTSRVATVDEFDRAFGTSGALQSWALDDIVDQLHVIRAELARDDLDEAKTALALITLTERFTGLAANAQAFSGDLQRTIDLRGIDTEAFLAYKERLIGYLQRFIQDLVARTAEIAGLLEGITRDDQDRLLRAAAEQEARDLAPGADDSSDVFDRVLSRWQERFSGFQQWFVGSADVPSQSQQLRHMALNAIPALLGVVQRLGERRAGLSDRAADFRTLALWFAEAPTDDDRHRLAAVAFGLDWGGVTIANGIHARFGFTPWRYRTDDLERGAELEGVALRGPPVDARWDPRLCPALERRGRGLEEEQVLGELVTDLAVGPSEERS